jgi:hypothetical protein
MWYGILGRVEAMGTKRVIWVADDGTEFDAEDAMTEYEADLRRVAVERRIEAFLVNFGAADEDGAALTEKGQAAAKTRARKLLEKFFAFEEKPDEKQ